MSSTTVSFRVTPEEKEVLEAVAFTLGGSLSEMVRAATFTVAHSTLQEHGRDTVLGRFRARRQAAARRVNIVG